jgi:hypothetical protein
VRECVYSFIVSTKRMNRASAKHICFYSNKCDWCKAFIHELGETPYKREFEYICVDPSPTRPPLPNWLKKVPTLVISGEQEPRTDSEVMNWLYERKLREGNGGTSNTVVSQNMGEPEPYLNTEMGGQYGDSYSFLNDDTSAQGNGGMSIAHNFSYLNGNNAVSSQNAQPIQVMNSTGKKSRKEEMLDQQFEAFQKQRDIGIPKKVARM